MVNQLIAWLLSLSAHVQRELTVVFPCVCCLNNICSTAVFWLKVSVYFIVFSFVDFAKSASFESYGE